MRLQPCAGVAPCGTQGDVMKIQVGGLSEGVHEYSFRIAPAELGLSREFQNGVDVKATIEKTSRQFLLRASVATEAEFECDRCVAVIREPVVAAYQMHYVWEETEAERIDPSEVQVILPGQSVIDVSDDVRQTVLLALPLKHVCREDCRGLCPALRKEPERRGVRLQRHTR